MKGYEEPDHLELRNDTFNMSAMEAAQDIYLHLLRKGYLDGQELPSTQGAHCTLNSITRT